MKTALLAAALFAAASAATFAVAQDAGLKPVEPANANASVTPAPPSAESPDARQVASVMIRSLSFAVRSRPGGR